MSMKQYSRRMAPPVRARAAALVAALGIGATVARLAAETAYPIVETRSSYAAPRHAGETRLGSLGSINQYPQQTLVTLEPGWGHVDGAPRGYLRFRWQFRSADLEEFAGFFATLGRIGIDTVQPDGTLGPTLDLRADSTLDLDDLSALGGEALSVEALRIVLRGDGRDQDLIVRFELEDGLGRKGAFRSALSLRGTQPRTLDIPLGSFPASIDRTMVKLVAVVIERLHAFDQIRNPDAGGFDLLELAWVDQDAPARGVDALLGRSDREFVLELARADFEALWRLADTATGASLDRTLFRDLIHWGATGWLMASLKPAVDLGWIPLAEAEERALRILRFLDQDGRWGDGAAGFVGNSRGVAYRFGGIDPSGLHGSLTGTRKIDGHRVNAVEASVIDTALLHLGILTAAAAFDGDSDSQREIRQRANAVLNRTRWPELLDPVTGQLYLAWKPARQTEGPFFATPAAFGGYWASHDAAGMRPLTIDYATSEGYMAALLAVGSQAHPVSASAWYKMIRAVVAPAGEPVVLTWPGPWFTYAFLTATYLAPDLGPDRGAEWGSLSVDWRANTAAALRGLQALGPSDRLLLPDACELPDTTYVAQGLPGLAVDPMAHFTGTVTPYSYQMAIGLGEDVAAPAIAELRRLLRQFADLWDPWLGVLDAAHPDLGSFDTTAPVLRRAGPWVQNQKWPLNAGAALLAQMNYLSDGVIWKTAAQHPVMQRALDAIYRDAASPSRQIILLRPWGHDAWSAAAGPLLLAVPDHYAEVIHLFAPDGAELDPITYEQIGELLQANSLSVERSGGPAGLRDAAVLPDGTIAVLIAGPGQDAILKLAADRSLSLLATGFEVSARGDDTGHTRMAAGGNPGHLVVSSQWPIGVAVLNLEGVLQRTIGLPQRPAGLAFASSDNRLYVLYPDGEVVVLPAGLDPTAAPAKLAQLPVGGRDLAYASEWRVSQPSLVAAGADGRLYQIVLGSGEVRLLEGEGLAGVVGIDVRGDRAVLAQDEWAILDIAPSQRLARLWSPQWRDGTFRCWIDAPTGAALVPEASVDLKSWTPAGQIVPQSPWLRLEDSAVAGPARFYRVRLE